MLEFYIDNGKELLMWNLTGGGSLMSRCGKGSWNNTNDFYYTKMHKLEVIQDKRKSMEVWHTLVFIYSGTMFQCVI